MQEREPAAREQGGRERRGGARQDRATHLRHHGRRERHGRLAGRAGPLCLVGPVRRTLKNISHHQKNLEQRLEKKQFRFTRLDKKIPK